MSTPTAVLDLAGVIDIEAGAFHTCATRGAGDVWCWGRNSEGQLGDGTTTSRTIPVRVMGLPPSR